MPYPSLLRVLLGRECIFFLSLILFFLGGYQTLVMFLGIGVLFCLFAWGGSSVLPNFQGLEVGSYSHHRVFGGDQSLDTCNSRIKLWGGWFVPG